MTDMKVSGSMALEGISWLGHAGLLIERPVTTYIDPFDLPADSPKADLILLTHPHYDHCSEEDVARIKTERTIIVGHRGCLSQLRLEQEPISVGESKQVLGIRVTAMPAFTVAFPYHPESKGWLGFLLEIEGRRLYYAGDMDLDAIKEFKGLKPDVAFLPVDDVYTMNSDRAVFAAEQLEAGFAVPIHYGSVCGRNAEAGKFVLGCRRKGIPADVFKPRGGARR